MHGGAGWFLLGSLQQKDRLPSSVAVQKIFSTDHHAQTPHHFLTSGRYDYKIPHGETKSALVVGGQESVLVLPFILSSSTIEILLRNTSLEYDRNY